MTSRASRISRPIPRRCTRRWRPASMCAAISSGRCWIILNGVRDIASASGLSTSITPPSAGCRRIRFAGSRTRSSRVGLLRFRLSDLIEREQQHGKAGGGGAPLRLMLVVVDQPVESHLNRNTGGGSLCQLAKRHGAGEIFRNAKKPAEHRREQNVRLRNERRAHQLPEQLSPSQQYLRQRAPNRALLL